MQSCLSPRFLLFRLVFSCQSIHSIWGGQGLNHIFLRIFAIHKRFEHPYFGIFAAEIAGLVVLWFFWILGAGIASVSSHSWSPSQQTNREFCFQTVLGPDANCRLSACSVASALLAFSWLGWITLSGILAVALLFSFANSAFREPLHGRWDPRQSMAVKV